MRGYNLKNKIKTYEQATAIAKRLRDEGNTIVTTNGTFDICHSAHQNMLLKAAEMGDYLFVLVNSDDSVRKNVESGDKNSGRPIQFHYERAGFLAAFGYVDYVTIFDEKTPLDILEKLKPHFHVKGGTYIPERVKAEEELLAKWGGKFVPLEEEVGKSTTALIKKIAEVEGL